MCCRSVIAPRGTCVVLQECAVVMEQQCRTETSQQCDPAVATGACRVVYDTK